MPVVGRAHVAVGRWSADVRCIVRELQTVPSQQHIRFFLLPMTSSSPRRMRVLTAFFRPPSVTNNAQLGRPAEIAFADDWWVWAATVPALDIHAVMYMCSRHRITSRRLRESGTLSVGVQSHFQRRKRRTARH